MLLLTVGRKLFWLVVAVMGFVSGLELAPQFIHEESRVALLAVALSMGLLGGMLAIFLQYLGVGIAGFIAGAHLTPVLLNLLNLQNNPYSWVLSLVGGIIAAVLALSLLNWALIILSSLVGASLICQGFFLQQTTATLIFFILVMVGVTLQSNLVKHPVTAS